MLDTATNVIEHCNSWTYKYMYVYIEVSGFLNLNLRIDQWNFFEGGAVMWDEQIKF